MGEEESYPFNDDILGGIKAAIERGEELKEAMITFYNAGYSKKEIEEAARQYLLEKKRKELIDEATMQTPVTFKENKRKNAWEILQKGKEGEFKPIEVNQGKETREILGSNLIKTTIKKSAKKPLQQSKPAKQVISKYGEDGKKKKHSIEPITIILLLLLFFLVLVLASVFLFREELVNFFNNLFG